MSCNLIQIVKAIQGALTPGRQPTREQVMHLLHFNSNAAFTDETGKSASAEGGVSLNTNTKVFGTASVNVTSGRVVLTDNATTVLGTSDFTIEMWVYPENMELYPGNTNYPWSGLFMKSAGPADSLNNLVGIFNKQGRIVFGSSNGSGTRIQTPDGVLLPKIWTHIALTREGNIFRIWVNGKKRAEMTANWNISESGYTRCGFAVTGGSGGSMNGYIDEFRLVKGLAVYYEEFANPSVPFTLPTA